MVTELSTFTVAHVPVSPAGLAKARIWGPVQSKTVGPLIENLSRVQGPSQCGAPGDCPGHTFVEPASDGPFPRAPAVVALGWGLRICFSHKFPSDVDTAGPTATGCGP